MSQLTNKKELFVIINELRKAITKSFKPDWFNYSFLGNATRHLHCHFIPRYSTTKKFVGITFTDKLYSHNYRTDNNFKISAEILEKIKLEIKENL